MGCKALTDTETRQAGIQPVQVGADVNHDGGLVQGLPVEAQELQPCAQEDTRGEGDSNAGSYLV
jgi:hypothetical protein